MMEEIVFVGCFWLLVLAAIELKKCHKKLGPIHDLCRKYHIPLEDVSGVLEEYILNDNDGYCGYSKCDDCKHDFEVKK